MVTPNAAEDDLLPKGPVRPGKLMCKLHIHNVHNCVLPSTAGKENKQLNTMTYVDKHKINKT